MRKPLTTGASLTILWLTACSSPADIEQRHADELAHYQDDLATAQQWDTHAYGIPAAGWVAIWITAAILTAALLALAGYALYRRTGDRAHRRHQLALAREHTRTELARRGPCPMCHYDPAATQEPRTNNG